MPDLQRGRPRASAHWLRVSGGPIAPGSVSGARGTCDSLSRKGRLSRCLSIRAPEPCSRTPRGPLNDYIPASANLPSYLSRPHHAQSLCVSPSARVQLDAPWSACPACRAGPSPTYLCRMRLWPCASLAVCLPVHPVLPVHLEPQPEISTGAAPRCVLLGSGQSASLSAATTAKPARPQCTGSPPLSIMPLLSVARLSRPVQLRTGSGRPVLARPGRPMLGWPRPGAMQPPPRPLPWGGLQ